MGLSIDIETYSAVDLSRSTVYRYSEDKSFEILLFGYALNDGPVQVIDLTREDLPNDVVMMLLDPSITKQAYNANFERVCLSKYLRIYLPPEAWSCTMVHALTLGLPRSLEDVGKVLGLSDDQAKMKEGKELIRYFCKPCKPTKANGGRTRNRPFDAPDKWEKFIEYNRRDVEVERTIRTMLESRPIPDVEKKAYYLDQRINDRGVLCDRKLVNSAIEMSLAHTASLTEEAAKLTGLKNTNSVSQLKGWLGVEGSLDKKTVAALRSSGQLGIREDKVLAIRQELGKTSISKYEAMERGMCKDGRVRGLFQFYGANRTGRWAGRQVQVQNLPQNKIPDLDVARQIVLDGDRDGLQCLYGNVPDTLSQLIRTAFIAGDRRVFAVADFSAIEARVIAWLSGERWRMDVFRDGKDIYCASASQMFRVPVEKHGVNGHLRQKGKIAELALGYGGSVGALKAMGAIEMGLQEEELKPLVDAWRGTNPMITAFWWDVDRAARAAINNPGQLQVLQCYKTRLAFQRSKKLLTIQLPSKRCINYWCPAITIDEETGRENITYGGLDAGKWGRIETYGPKLVENIVQATARDCLRDAMIRMNERYHMDIVMHVHDEVIVETNEEDAEQTLEHMQHCMNEALSWAPELLLRGDGYLTDYYRKD